METMPIDNKFELFKLIDPKRYEPIISEETMLLHHGKHLATYVNNLNNLLPGTLWEGLSLEEVVRRAPEGAILNNAGQILNHNMFFEQLASTDFVLEGPITDLDLYEELNKQYGNYKNFKEQFTQAGLTLFGSGWVWLSVDDQGKLVITQEPPFHWKKVTSSNSRPSRADAATHHRCVGTRLLRRLPEPSSRVPRKNLGHHRLESNHRPLPRRPAILTHNKCKYKHCPRAPELVVCGLVLQDQ